MTGLILVAAFATALTGSSTTGARAAGDQGDAESAWQRVQGQLGAADAQDQPVAVAIETWRTLGRGGPASFATYAGFLMANPGWPDEKRFRELAEKAVSIDRDSPSQIADFFFRFPARSAQGKAAQALALMRLGRTPEAQAAARDAWAMGTMPVEIETSLLSTFASSLTPADHLRHADAVLWARDTAAAGRVLAYVPVTRQAVVAARIAIQQGAADANAKVDAADPVGAMDAGYLADKVRWLRASGNEIAARRLLAGRMTLAAPAGAAEKWFETMLVLARGAANDGDWATAYAIASKVDDAYPAGTDVSAKSLGERDDYTSLTWLAGTAALDHLGKPRDAEGMFARYGGGARSPQTISKGFYWAGRAALDAGRQSEAQAYFAQAGAFPDQFYGQLALERLGRPVPAPQAAVAEITPADRTAFAAMPVVRAALYLGRQGAWADQTRFVRAIAEHAETDKDHHLAAELSRAMDRPDLGVMVGRRATASGLSGYGDASFPRIAVPDEQRDNWTMIHAIARQESQFDKAIVSYAGARGLMQLMPGTAREVAGKQGLPYNVASLFEPSYNVTLGSTYFMQMLRYYGGSYPLAVAAYNAGPGNVNKWMRALGDPREPGTDIVRWIEQIPIYQTKDYVQRVLENAVIYDLLNPSRQTTANAPLSRYLGKARPG